MQFKLNQSIRAAGLVLALLALGAAPASAQVPQDMTFSGRLVDGSGTPLVGPVSLDLYIYPDATLPGGLIFGERHNGVPLDALGNFSVLLGSGNQPISGSFDAATFSSAERYVEVVVVDNPTPGLHVLSPRVPISSVPYALVAQQANEIVPDPSAPRFEDCGDGTVADHQTGLQWEKKTGTVGSQVICFLPSSCLDPHVVNNSYSWSASGAAPDGNAFTSFLAKLNDPTFGEVALGAIYGIPASTGCFAAHCDWRLPIIDELGTIRIGTEAAPGQAQTCSTAPCIDPDFGTIGGPTVSEFYWSASTWNTDPNYAVWAHFDASGGGNAVAPKSSGLYVRAVRTGSCN